MSLLVPSKGHRRRSSSKEIIGYNEDLVGHILLYLPVKSILRFKSVSKQWHNLISGPIFIQRHASRQTTSNSILIFHHHGIKSLYLKGNNHRLDTVDFGFVHNYRRDYLIKIKSCNGLLLVQSYNFRAIEEELQRRRLYHVYNPFTRKHKELAVHDHMAIVPCMYFDLAFDPSKSPHYKVVFSWRDSIISCHDYHIAIYSSETRTCRKLGYTFESRFDWLFSGVFLNGAIHWINDMKRTSFYFDINRELLKVYPMPPRSGLGNGNCKYFGKCQGHLSLILGDQHQLRQRVLDVYELKKDYSSWFVKYKIDLDVIAVGFPEIIITRNNSEKRYDYSFLYLLEDEEEEPTLVVAVANLLLGYNFIHKTTNKFRDVGHGTEGRTNDRIGYMRSCWWYDAVHCKENLFDV